MNFYLEICIILLTQVYQKKCLAMSTSLFISRIVERSCPPGNFVFAILVLVWDTRQTTKLLCASYRSNCRRGGKIVIVIRQKGHSPQKLPNRRRAPPRVMTSQKSVTTLDRCTCHKWLTVVWCSLLRRIQ